MPSFIVMRTFGGQQPGIADFFAAAGLSPISAQPLA
jgi:hypothetical protein